MKDTFDSASKIGERLKKLRLTRNWTLSDVAQLTGISVGTLSKLENGKTNLNFSSVNKLAEGLRVPVTELTSPSTEGSGRRAITLGGDGVVFNSPDADYEVLCSGVSGQNQGFLRATIKMRELDPSMEWHRHGGEEFIYVLSGAIELHTEFYEPLSLKEGDSILFDSSMGHHYLTTSEQNAECLISFSLRGYRNVADSLSQRAKLRK